MLLFSPRLSLRILNRKRVRLEYACSIHDFSLSRNYGVFYLSPYILDMRAFIHDGLSLIESLNWEPERGSRLLIVRRDTGEQAAILPVGERACLHLINCFESDDRLNIDVLELDRPIYDQYQQVPELFVGVAFPGRRNRCHY